MRKEGRTTPLPTVARSLGSLTLVEVGPSNENPTEISETLAHRNTPAYVPPYALAQAPTMIFARGP